MSEPPFTRLVHQVRPSNECATKYFLSSLWTAQMQVTARGDCILGPIPYKCSYPDFCLPGCDPRLLRLAYNRYSDTDWKKILKFIPNYGRDMTTTQDVIQMTGMMRRIMTIGIIRMEVKSYKRTTWSPIKSGFLQLIQASTS